MDLQILETVPPIDTLEEFEAYVSEVLELVDAGDFPMDQARVWYRLALLVKGTFDGQHGPSDRSGRAGGRRRAGS